MAPWCCGEAERGNGRRNQDKPEDWFEKCTVVKDMMIAEGSDSYRVLSDDPKGGIGAESSIRVPFIKAWANATPQDVFIPTRIRSVSVLASHTSKCYISRTSTDTIP